MDKMLKSSDISVSVHLDREVYSENNTEHPYITSDVSMERTFWIEGGSGTDGQVDHNVIEWVASREEYMLVTNSDDMVTFDDYEEATEEMIDRLTAQFRKRLKDALILE